MLQGYVLRYLGMVAAGTPRAEARRRVSPLLRPLVQRAATRRLAAAAFSTEHAANVAHVHRLAYLAAAGATTIDENDVQGIARTFEARRRLGVEKRAPLTLLGSVGALAVVVALAVAGWPHLMRGGGDRNAANAPAAEEAPGPLTLEEDAPEERHPLDSAFGERLPAWVVALDRNGATEEAALEEAEAALLDEVRERGPALADPLARLLDTARGYVAGEEGVDGIRWLNELALFHDALRENEVPFYVDAMLRADRRTGRRRVLLSTWDVRKRRLFSFDDAPVRALDLLRKDRLNFDNTLLGYTRPEARDALVVVDHIEAFLVDDVLPTVHSAEASVIVRDYADETDTGWVDDFERWAHEDLRRESEEIVVAEGISRRALAVLAEAIVDRRNAVTQLSSSLGPRMRLREPSTYAYDVAQLELPRRHDRAALAAVRGAEIRLRTTDIRRAYEVLLEARATSVAEHEVQHRLDYRADRLIAVPDVLARYTGETGTLEHVNRRAERANAELSAYLSQIAQRPSLAWTSLVHVAGFMMSRPSWRMPEAYAAAALFEALADEAGIAHGPLISNRRIDRAEATRIYGALRDRGERALSPLAAATWTHLYGAALPEIRQAD